MVIHPTIYTKEEFIKFLKKNNTDNNIINKFKELPEIIERMDGKIFYIYIHSLWHDVKKPYYEFELNYYSEELIEYLFSSKVFKDVEHSINYMICELKNINHLDKQ